MKIDRELLTKYSNPVPRYTSYPPANYFVDGFTHDDGIRYIEQSNSWEPENISIYIHIPFCHKLCFYCGCNSCPLAKQADIVKYINSVKKEISLVMPLLSKNRKISQIHYGGGTPNAIDVNYLQELNQLFFDHFSFIDHPEIAIECHPAYLDEKYVNELKRAGFNRFSLGIQDFNTDVLKNVNRAPSQLPVHDLMEILRSGDQAAINLDFIYGLPGQTVNGFSKTILEAVQLKPDRLVTFSYAHVPWVNKNQLILEKKGLPTPEAKTDMFEQAYNTLTSNGYQMIGMDHYVLEADELNLAQRNKQLHRNFQGYCTRRTTGQVYAFGVSAITQLHRVYMQNIKSIDQYNSLLSEEKLPLTKGYELSTSELITRDAIAELMCNKVLDLRSILDNSVGSSKKTGQVLVYNEEKLSTFENDGILEIKDGIIKISDNGNLFVRNVAAALDPLMVSSEKRFSKSV